MLLVLFLWIAFFLDVLESFCWDPVVSLASSPSSLFSCSPPYMTRRKHLPRSSLADKETDITLTLPPFAGTTDGDYPSPLHHLHVRSLLSEDEAKTCLALAADHAEATGRWLKPDSERHQSYATCDFPVEDCQALFEFLEEIDFDGRLFHSLSELYTVDVEDLSYLDLFVAHYQAKDDDGKESSQIMDRLELHRDGSILAFSMLLNSPDDFEGGGTCYDALRDEEPHGILHPGGVIRPEKPGDAVLHCGKILHGADTVTKGSRTVLVGFVDVSERCQRAGVLAESCTTWGRMDVVKYRLKRQESKGHKGWTLNNDRWLQGSHSAFKGFVPAFQSLIRRSNPELCRRRRLEAEDSLLRSILLPREERSNDLFDGDITIL